MPADYFYHQGTKYWLYGSYADKTKATRIAQQLRKRYKTKYMLIATDSYFGNYPIWHLYTARVRRIWS